MTHDEGNSVMNGGASLTQRVNSASENAYLKFLSRIVVPPVLAIVGYLMVWTLNSVKDEIDKTKTFVQHVMDLSQQTHTELAVTKEDLARYRERQEDIRKVQDDSAKTLNDRLHDLDVKTEAVRNLIIGQGQRGR
jgi:hypothetical protein